LQGGASKINYYRSKYRAELEVLGGISRGLDAVILNPAQIVGPYDYHYTPLIFDSIKKGIMPGVPRGGSVLGHVRDYARAHVTAYEKGRTGERYLLGGVHASFREIFAVVGALVGKKNPTLPLPPLLLSALAVLLDQVSRVTRKEPLLSPEKVMLLNNPVRISSAKAEQELGFSTCSMPDMFADCYRWMQGAGLA
jgi:nucleoside-diphosphate-sugar epimerase